MKAEERAKKLSKCAGNLEECDGLENLYVFAVEQIRQAEAAARAEECRICAGLAQVISETQQDSVRSHEARCIAAAILARNEVDD